MARMEKLDRQIGLGTERATQKTRKGRSSFARQVIEDIITSTISKPKH
jgi:hypothetical protein